MLLVGVEDVGKDGLVGKWIVGDSDLSSICSTLNLGFSDLNPSSKLSINDNFNSFLNRSKSDVE